MQHFVWGILLLPLAGFVVNSLGIRLSNRAVTFIGPGSVFLAFICAVICFFWLQGQPESARFYDQYGWHWSYTAGIGQFHLDFRLWLDPLSSVMTLVITGVGFLILVYAIGYMRGDNGYRRFFAQMDLFIFTMLLLVLADNYLWLLVGWAGVGLTSYLLIGFYQTRPSAVSAARKAFVMNVIGDWGIMIALFMMFQRFGAVDFQSVFSKVSSTGYNGQFITLLGLFLLVGAVAKSAQIPLYTWLPDAMEGPTPVSALIHAATMVTAGVYLIARSYPIYEHSPNALHTVAIIGGIGTLYAGSMGLANNDIKRVLAYSTMSQIAYMFVGVGVAYYYTGMLQLVEHAFFKALLFMGAGAVMHALHDELNIQKMGGLRHKMPFTYWTFLIGVLSIAGIPLFAGFSGKEDVITAAFHRASAGDSVLWIVWVLAVLAAGVTAAYMFRLLFLVFHGEPRDRDLQEHAHDPDIAMRIPMAILAVLSVAGFWLSVPGKYDAMESWLNPVFQRYYTIGPVIGSEAFTWTSLLLVLAATVVGFLIALQIYFRRNPAPDRVGAYAPWLYNLLYHKYYVDELYDVMFVRPIKWLGAVVYRIVDQDFIDGIVNSTGYLTRMSSSLLRRIQTGYARNYALYILFGAVIVVGYYIVGGR